MSTHVRFRYAAIAETAAGLGRSDGGRTLVADRPRGRAGGLGLGCSGGDLLAAALGGCFWNDLHYVADAAGAAVRVETVEADIELAGNPPRVVRAHVTARLAGNDEHVLQRIFETAAAASTVANSLTGAFPTTFDRMTGDPR